MNVSRSRGQRADQVPLLRQSGNLWKKRNAASYADYAPSRVPSDVGPLHFSRLRAQKPPSWKPLPVLSTHSAASGIARSLQVHSGDTVASWMGTSHALADLGRWPGHGCPPPPSLLAQTGEGGVPGTEPVGWEGAEDGGKTDGGKKDGDGRTNASAQVRTALRFLTRLSSLRVFSQRKQASSS